MNAISFEDRVKIQSHLAEIWKILYANGLEDIESQRTPNSKQKKRMWEMLVKYNKNHAKLTDGFSLCVSDHDGCWCGIEFASTQEEDDYRKRKDESCEVRSKRNERKMKRQRELEEEHHVACWHKYHMSEYWTSGFSCVRYSKQNDEGTLTFVKANPDAFVHWLYHGVDQDGKSFTDEARIKYMKKYGLDKDYDLNTGHPIKDDIGVEDSTKIVENKKEDKAKNVKNYLREKFRDGSWRDEALDMSIEPKESVDTYLDTVREFIYQQEELDLHGVALYHINEERTNAHEEMLKEYGLDGYDEKSEVARDVTKSFDFVGEYKSVNGKMKTVTYPEAEASLRLAYAFAIVMRECN